VIKYFILQPQNVTLKFATGSKGASGYDLCSANDMPREITAGGRFVFRTGIFLEMPAGVEAQIRGRSGLTRDWGVGPMGIGTVDSDYRGEISVVIFNIGHAPYTVNTGDRIAQLVFAPVLPAYAAIQQPEYNLTVVEVMDKKQLQGTDRGASGFGSTGR